MTSLSEPEPGGIASRHLFSEPVVALLQAIIEYAAVNEFENVPTSLIGYQLSQSSATAPHPSLLGHLVTKRLSGNGVGWKSTYRKLLAKVARIENPNQKRAGFHHLMEPLMTKVNQIRTDSDDWFTTTHHIAEAILSPEFAEKTGVQAACRAAGVTTQMVLEELRGLFPKSEVVCDSKYERGGTCKSLLKRKSTLHWLLMRSIAG